MIARYTEVLCNLMENPQTKELLDKALSSYPVYVPKYDDNYSIIPTRKQINEKLLNHYKYREIGFETVGRFLDELEITMNEIMPYYYQLFKSADILNGIDDPFGNVDIKEIFEQETTGKSSTDSNNKTSSSTESSAESDSNVNSKSIGSQTPNGILDVGTKNIDGVTYGDEASWNESISNSKDSSEGSSESSSEGSSESTSEGTLKHTFTKVGNQGVNTYAHDLKELRETFLNIEMQIIEDPKIKELFMLVY